MDFEGNKTSENLVGVTLAIGELQNIEFLKLML